MSNSEGTLPDYFDLIIIGTGLTEAIIGAAAARIGKSVLHLSKNKLYGGLWTSFSLDELLLFVDELQSEAMSPDKHKQENDILDVNFSKYIRNVQYKFHREEDDEDQIELMRLKKRFSFDLFTSGHKLLYCNGELINLLLQSGVSKYGEYRLIDQLLSLSPTSSLEKIPYSKGDVFKSKTISLLEKRRLMQFISMMYENEIMDLEEATNGHHELYIEYKNLPFEQFLKSRGFGEQLSNGILYLIGMCEKNCLTRNALNSVRMFFRSIGIYGNGSILFPLHGLGDIPQFFSRLCAVFGGIHYLNAQPDRYITENRRVKCVEFDNDIEGLKQIKCENLIIGEEYSNKFNRKFLLKREKEELVKCIIVYKSEVTCFEKLKTNQLELNSDSMTLLRCCANSFNESFPSDVVVTWMDLSSASSCSPNHYRTCYLTTEKKKKENFDYYTIFRFIIETYFKDEILFECLFEQVMPAIEEDRRKLITGLHLTRGPSISTVNNSCSSEMYDCQSTLNEAKRKFHELFGEDAEYLRPPPNPENIIIE
ncbi:hypothetical protein SNEBB_004219 [Seison nebaliae]|nr:hypothetical protein SNEBB_004219 [Seison nebaliae]